MTQAKRTVCSVINISGHQAHYEDALGPPNDYRLTCAESSLAEIEKKKKKQSDE
jgi:hypothetical protein